MSTRERTFSDGSRGTVSAVLSGPENEPRALVVLAHGAGSDRTNPFLAAVSEGLVESGFAILRFNFPYREAGRRIPDARSVLERCYRSVIEAARTEVRPKRLVIGGRSMGGRIASHLAAAGDPVDGLIFLAYPLHPPGKTDRLRDEHLPRIAAPMLFFAGTRDSLADLGLLEQTLARLGDRAALHVIEGGDHSLRVPKRLDRSEAEIQAEVVCRAAEWLETIS